MFQLRAATSLSRLYEREGRRHDARDALLETYKRFTEGFDTADLQEASAILEQLGVP
jgi:predicted ATPase